jgi:hypothetical protein
VKRFTTVVLIEGEVSKQDFDSSEEAYLWGCGFAESEGSFNVLYPPIANWDGEELTAFRYPHPFVLAEVRRANSATHCHYCGQEMKTPYYYFGKNYGREYDDPKKYYPAAYCSEECWGKEDMGNQ